MTDELTDEPAPMTVQAVDLSKDREQLRDAAIRAIRALEADDVERVMHFFGYDDPRSGAVMSAAIAEGMSDRCKEEHQQMRSLARSAVMNEHRNSKGMDGNFLRAMYLVSMVGFGC